MQLFWIVAVKATRRDDDQICKLNNQLLELYGQATKCTRWMPRQTEAMKDVGACDKVRGAGKHALILTFPNGETHSTCRVSIAEYIGYRGEPGELKHLSTRRKRNQPRSPE